MDIFSKKLLITDRIYWKLRLFITSLNQYMDSSENLLISKKHMV